MSEQKNRRVALVSRPDGLPVDTDFRVEDVAPTAPEAGEVQVAVEVLSVDAFVRTVLDEDSFHGSVPIGGTVTAIGVGTVIESASDQFSPGDAVVGGLGVQTIATVPAATLQPIDVTALPARTHLGALGLTTGLTAYMGMTQVGHVGEGDTVVVSGAAGAVGSIAGQIARLSGAGKVIGIAGGPQKGAFLVDQLGYHAAIDYKAGDVGEQLDALAPEGIDVFFDNVGGPILDAVMFRIREQARVVICGAISQYDDMDNVMGPSNYLKLAERYARMEGFTVLHFPEKFEEARAALAAWLLGGDLIMSEEIVEGVEQFPAALDTLLTGGHKGKLLVQVA